MLIRSYLVVFAIFLFTSCSSYQNLSIDVLIPAKHTFQPEIKSVVLVDNSMPFREGSPHEVKLVSSKFTVDTIWLDQSSSITLESLKEELQNRNFFDSVYLHPGQFKTNERLINRALNWQQISSLCELYNADAVIAYEKNIYRTKIGVKNMYDGNLFGYMDASGAILWRGYNILEKELIFKEAQADTISWEAVDVNIEKVSRKLPRIKDGLIELAEYQGAKIANDLAPYWESQERGYYDAGNYQFMQASEFVRNEQWGEAIKLWKYVFDHSKKKTKARAAYNLALASEISGDYESARYWLDEGVLVLSEIVAHSAEIDKVRMVKYSIFMDNRLKIVETLKHQIGGEE